MSDRYTVITFAPVQGFIEKSRKLRDLYGSSFILSYLSDKLCLKAESSGFQTISPARINVAQGTPNQILIKGYFPEQDAKNAFAGHWEEVVDGCRTWLETNVKCKTGETFEYAWQRNWNLWKSHAWEFFWESGNSITEAREALNEKKRSRNWVGINWTGESSTLSGADGIAWHRMDVGSPKERSMAADDDAIGEFYDRLSDLVGKAIVTKGEAIVTKTEQLSIPELIKRLVTIKDVVEHIGIDPNELPKSFKELNRYQEDAEDNEPIEIARDERQESRYSGWFQGDGDRAGDLLKKLAGTPQEEDTLYSFSRAMRQWGESLDLQLPKSRRNRNISRKDGTKVQTVVNLSDGRIIYAGGDDLLGVLYRNYPDPILTGYECIQWFYKFESERVDTIWKQHKQPISISIGFVWAAQKVPQREILQHCREAEKSAKSNGKDRLAIRILFNSGNYLEWVCPWWLLDILEDYRDRDFCTGNKANWSHIYEDVALLECRHAFATNTDNERELQNCIQIALSLLEIYFPHKYQIIKDPDYWFEDCTDKGLRTGVLGASKNEVYEALKNETYSNAQNQFLLDKWAVEKLNNWVINLAKVGFHLCRQRNQLSENL